LPPLPEPEPEPGGKPCPPLPLPLPPEPDDELPPFRFWLGPVGNGPCVLPLPLPPDDELPPFRFWFGPVGNEPFVLLPPPRAIAPEAGRATPTVAIATPSMMLSRLVIIVAPLVARDKSQFRKPISCVLVVVVVLVATLVQRRNNSKGSLDPRPCIFVCSECERRLRVRGRIGRCVGRLLKNFRIFSRKKDEGAARCPSSRALSPVVRGNWAGDSRS